MKGNVVLKVAKWQDYLLIQRTRKPDQPASLSSIFDMGTPHLPGDLKERGLNALNSEDC